MEKQYSITKDESIDLAWEYILHRGRVRRFLCQNILLVSIALAVGYALTSPPESLVNDQPSPTLSLLLMLFIQVPLLVLMFRFILGLFIYQPKKTLEKQSNKLPASHWGSRTFMITDDSVKLKSPDTEIKVGGNLIEAVDETNSGIHLIQGGQSWIQLPKSVFSVNDVRTEISKITNDNKTRQ